MQPHSGKYFPLSSSLNMPAGAIFPYKDGSSGLLENCQITYNMTAPTQEELQKRYHYTDADLRDSTRIIWSLGQYDTTSAVSPTQIGIKPIPSTDRNVSRILYTSDMAHREDLFAPDPSDRDTVIQVGDVSYLNPPSPSSKSLGGFFRYRHIRLTHLCYRRDKSS
jgi:hypothetical protein